MAASTINVVLGLNSAQFEKNIRKVQRQMTQVAKQFEQFGKSMSTYVTAPIVAMGAASVAAFDKQAKAIAQVEAGLISTRNQVGFTSKELQKMASDLQEISLFGDEEILSGVTAQLLTFTNISGEQFEKTQVAALNLATRLDGDLKSASIQLGKALNDPVANLSALSRSGIQFSENQKEVIKSLWETGRQAEAQALILEELEKQYGGSAEAAAKAGAGPLKQLQNSLGDLSESFGEIILVYITPLIEKMKQLVAAWQNTSAATKKLIVNYTLLAAAIGPVALIIGKLILIFKTVVGLMTLAAAKILLVVAAVAALAAGAIYLAKNWEAVTERFHNLLDLVRNYLIQAFTSLLGVVQKVAGWLGFEILDDSIERLEALKKEVAENEVELVGFGEILSGMTGQFNSLIGNLFGATDAFSELTNETKRPDLVNGLQKIERAFERVQVRVAEATRGFAKFREQTKIVAQGGRGAEEIANRYADAYNKINSAIVNTIETSIAGTAEMVGTMVAMGEGFDKIAISVGRFLLDTLANLMIKVGTAAIATGKTLEAIRAGLISLLGVPSIIAGVALIALGGAIKGTLAATAPQPTAFAEGGIVSGPTNALIGEYSGARNNPEVVAPLDKLTAILANSLSSMGLVPNQMTLAGSVSGGYGGGAERGSMQVEVQGVIRGKDIYLSNKRYNNNINRTT